MSIPIELQRLDQWVSVNVVWNEDKQKFDKYPVDPKTGKAGSVSDPSTWGSYAMAVSHGMPVGFVLTEQDPFCIIDLDTYDKPELVTLHHSILREVSSYVETSYSGKGSHIVVKGSLPSGLRDDRHGIEVYPHGRFVLMTGNVVGTEEVRNDQELLDYLASQINAKRVATVEDLQSQQATHTDEQVWELAANADNGDKFKALFSGQWNLYPEYMNDHSRADLGLLTFLDFYTQDVDQVVRLFKMSALYRPEKGRRNTDGTDYIVRTLKAARARNMADHPPLVDATELMARTQQAMKPPIQVPAPEIPITTEVQPLPPSSLTPPPGLVGEIARYIYTAAVRPVPEVAIMGAIAMMAGIVGRQYNISGTGLNLYLILLAPTGSGKEAASSGISSIMKHVQATVPAAEQFIGPADFASGQGLVKALNEKPCMFCLLGEFGLRIQQMAEPRAPAPEKMLQKGLLNLFSKSGWSQMESGVAYSNKENNTATLHAPALTLFGESTAEEFYSSLNESHVNSGLLPRFMFREYNGHRPERNKTTAYCAPSEDLIRRVSDLISGVIQMQANSSCYSVPMNNDAVKLMDDFDAYADTRIEGSTEMHRQLWNRAHLKALRLAAVLAVGCNPYNPIVDRECAEWAINFVREDVGCIESRFDNEMVGNGPSTYEAAARKAVEDYLSFTPEQRRKYKVSKVLMDDPTYIPFSYLRRRLRVLSSIQNDRRGAVVAIRETLQDLCEGGILQEVPPLTLAEKFGGKVSTKLYVIGESW